MGKKVTNRELETRVGNDTPLTPSTERASLLSRAAYCALLILIALIAFDLRIFEIATRPPHSDEGVNFLFIGTTNTKGYYPYSHENYHGPLFFYIVTAFVNMLGDSLLGLRSSTILFGMLILALCPFMLRIASREAVVLASLFIALSPSLVFFSRYAIHETLFVFASLGFAIAYSRWFESPRPIFWYAVSFFLAVLITTKETFIIFLFSMVVSTIALDIRQALPLAWSQRKHIGYAYLLCLLLVLFTYSGGFRWPDGIGEMFLAIPQWFGRSQSDVGHFKRFAYYLHDVIWVTEPYLLVTFLCVGIALVLGLLRAVPKLEISRLTRETLLKLLAALGAWLLLTTLIVLSSRQSSETPIDASFPNPYLCSSALLFVFLAAAALEAQLVTFLGRLQRATLFFGLWTLSTFIVYSFVQYKTVWLEINFTLPAAIFSALALAALLERKEATLRWLAISGIFAILITTGPNTLRYNYARLPLPGLDAPLKNPAPYGLENPFSYVHTSPGMLDLVEEVEAYWEKKPDARVLIGLEGYFPLPYYFRNRQSQCGYEVPKSIDEAAKNYDVLILDFYKQKWSNPNWESVYHRLSDYTESTTFFRRLPTAASEPKLLIEPRTQGSGAN